MWDFINPNMLRDFNYCFHYSYRARDWAMWRSEVRANESLVQVYLRGEYHFEPWMHAYLPTIR